VQAYEDAFFDSCRGISLFSISVYGSQDKPDKK